MSQTRFFRGLAYGLLFAGAFWTVVLGVPIALYVLG